ncbi:MAG TPA: hypothetical protein VJC08_04185 [bacterium]|nr:hypothetical protein [bacterium]
MPISLKKIHHLIRYFVVIGFVVFTGYIKHWQEDVFLILIGPVLYLAYTVKEGVVSLISLPEWEPLNFYGFLLPVCVLYFGLLGFQLKQLWNERGKIRFLSLFALLTFVAYIHYTSWKSLSDYLLAPGAPSAPAASLNRGPAADRPLGNNQGQAVQA